MEEKKIVKISLIQAVLIIVVILAIIFGIIFYIYQRQITPSSNITSTTGATSTTTIYSDTKKNIPTSSNIKYSVLSSSYYGSGKLENLFVTSNEELKTHLLECFRDSASDLKYLTKTQDTYILNQITVKGQPILTYFNDNFFEKNNLAIQMYDASSSNHSYSIISVTGEKANGIVNIKDDYNTYGGPFATSTHFNFIILDKSINNVNYDIYRTTTNNSYEIDFGMFFIAGIVVSIVVIAIVSILIVKHNKKIENKSNTKKPIKKIIFGIMIVILLLILIFFAIISFEALMTPNTESYKPIIYLYPTEEQNVWVRLLNNDMITVSYPKYINGWNVLAKKDGTLVDLSRNKELYSLYYECKNKLNFKIENDGFIVKGEDISTFLEEKLAILGLTEREAEEFIIYWLPKLEANKYNYIRFATTDEINRNMPLDISPNPDTIIRVLMTFKGLENPISVQEQQLEAPNRTGFVVVEWGGTEIQ